MTRLENPEIDIYRYNYLNYKNLGFQISRETNNL